MDIRLLIDPDSSASIQARPPKQQPEWTFKGAFHGEPPSPSSSSHTSVHSVQSPYSQTPATSLSDSPHPSPVALSHSPDLDSTSSLYSQKGQRPSIFKPPIKKKRRPSQIPIYARSCLTTSRSQKPANGNAHVANSNPSLRPWEPNILNMELPDENVRRMCDFLFNEVVRRDDVGAGARLEIEAKIGQFIDKNTNERLRLPVITECILSNRDPGLRITFQSSMTEAQHRSLNGYLNTALGNSQPSKPQSGVVQSPGCPRIPMSYVHTYESDSFFELSQSGVLSLPASIRAQLNPRQPKAKVRVTSDQKTGEEIARIIKARVADLDIYSPGTAFDWRVSVNIEMDVDEDFRTKIDPVSMDGKRPDRKKDRMSYKHLAYQIDLTQVTSSEATSKAEKTHELEIEVSSAEIRKQGLLAKEGLPNDYERLIEGFVNNVRILVKNCQ